nr:immunoglobulin light chain junction region [Macaca mulatta]
DYYCQIYDDNAVLF